MPNVAEIIREHVTLDVKCVDRLYLNGYIPRLQSEGGVVAFLRQAGARAVPSPAIFGTITDAFKARLRAWCERRQIPWIDFPKGERKDDIVQKYRDRFPRRPASCWWGWRRNARGAGRPARPSGGGGSISPGGVSPSA